MFALCFVAPVDGGEASGTKTPPNTPDMSHASPVTVQPEVGAASTSEHQEEPPAQPTSQSQEDNPEPVSAPPCGIAEGSGSDASTAKEGLGDQLNASSPIPESENPKGDKTETTDTPEPSKWWPCQVNVPVKSWKFCSRFLVLHAFVN